ncbi:GL10202 [Drosophila persimilis]|uniref:GL10202 n=1 Tax=Drosophila persimilis TaxID=7234 RepID=B4H520_DROPE|nr:GL10202 [Drosophila persimilis]
MQYSSSSENYSSSLRDTPAKWNGKNDKNYAYKKSSYQYSSSGDNNMSYQGKSPDQNIDQLDALLEDLKQERQITNRDRDLLPTNGTSYRTLERTDPAGTVTRTTRVVKTTKHSGQGGSGQQPYIDDVETFNPTDYSTLQSTAKYSSLKRDDYQTKEKPYTLSHSPISGGQYESKSKIYESNRTINNNVEVLPSSGITQTLTSGTTIDKELQDIALSDGILPAPGTKVTTTVRTYTYEIPAGPGSATSTINRSHTLNNSNTNTLSSSYKLHESHNSSQNFSQLLPQPHPHPHPQPSQVPQTVVYNTESYSTLNKPDRPLLTNQSYEIREHKETTTRGVSPQPRQLPLGTGPVGTLPGNNSRTVVYNIHKTDNVNTINELPPQQRYPPHSPAHSPNYAQGPHSPPLHTSGPGGLPPSTAYPQPQTGNGYPPNTSYTYKYSSTTNTNNRRGPGGGPDYGSPSPFPVDGVEYPVGNGNPPQRVDDLMQSFGTIVYLYSSLLCMTDHVDRGDLETPVRKREIETSVASPNQQHVPSVNKLGKEVYYPPGHDTIVMKREEMHAGSASGGRWAKGSGMYEYESGSKSKTKTKSGGAVVPLCLPLCCAMPCSIM